jgi:hypothetical protein
LADDENRGFAVDLENWARSERQVVGTDLTRTHVSKKLI